MIVKVKIVWDSRTLVNRVQKGGQRFHGIARQHVQAIGRKVRDRAEFLSPEDTGEFATSWQYRTKDYGDGNIDLTLQNRAAHAKFVLFGTKPHKIRPKNRKVLAFQGLANISFGKGLNFQLRDTVFVKEVNHPGTKPNNIFEKLKTFHIIEDEKPKIERKWQDLF